ncbi:acetoacetate decarboxylase [Carbonactinospora thermoautotrophica]|uniref:Acetoacetate decarboxylase n=1 Tax=Carbonactinospora thermoautotrophica TaxID=1469144 RepID=A0A132N6C2_9ACTN|nr:acetoacetate decarboxylase family protein [Carbonactinospora thermoautotrophica]KWX01333.1 Acetoacetate decarboxylase [Carbonactinospora thermoautotrophica]KWX05711.1 hypothetical protein TH66_01310 [Carbonactinospora thermoautotrophica]KWX08964.1 hypothetical protein TR74_12485 [Carbonactinospora thermoautotrophica]MCX9192784.1 acetoacetate decarboxylase [Carbonactinospora thermoautotrophica]
MAYPPAPWRLCGQLYGSVWRVPAADLPGPLPPGTRPVTFGRHGVVVTAWVDYQAGGVLRYHELLTLVLLRSGAAPLATVTRIWVDSPESRDGGRELWGFPKELARFELVHEPVFRATAYAGERELARGGFRAWLALPGRVPLRGQVVQELAGRALRTRAVMSGRVELGSGRLAAAPDGPLGFLAGRRPLASFAVRDFRLLFG